MLSSRYCQSPKSSFHQNNQQIQENNYKNEQSLPNLYHSQHQKKNKDFTEKQEKMRLESPYQQKRQKNNFQNFKNQQNITESSVESSQSQIYNKLIYNNRNHTLYNRPFTQQTIQYNNQIKYPKQNQQKQQQQTNNFINLKKEQNVNKLNNQQQQKQLPPLNQNYNQNQNLSQNKMRQLYMLQQQQQQAKKEINNNNNNNIINFMQNQQKQSNTYLKIKYNKNNSLLTLENQKQQQTENKQNQVQQESQIEKIFKDEIPKPFNQTMHKIRQPIKYNTYNHNKNNIKQNNNNNINNNSTINSNNNLETINYQQQNIYKQTESLNNEINKFSISNEDLEKFQKCKFLTVYGQLETKQEQKPQVSSKSWSVFELETQKFIDGKSAYSQREVASLTKIMTFYTTLRIIESYKLKCKEIIFYVSKWASKISGTTANLKSDMEISLYDLFYGIMLPSGNDAAFCVAENMGVFLNLNDEDKDIIYNKEEFKQELSETKNPVFRFLQQMNKYGNELEIASNYANPHGLMNKDNKSSASDVAKLSCKALEYPLFQEVVKTIYYESKIKRNGKDLVLKWENTNKLLQKNQRWFGLKTGITVSAGPCLASAVCYYDNFAKKDRKYVIVILSCKSMESRWEETEKIGEWAHRRICQREKENYFNDFMSKKGINISQLKMNLIKLKQLNMQKQELNRQSLQLKQVNSLKQMQNLQQFQNQQNENKNNISYKSSINNSQIQNSYNQLPTDDTNNQELNSNQENSNDSGIYYSQYSDSEKSEKSLDDDDINDIENKVQQQFENQNYSFNDGDSSVSDDVMDNDCNSSKNSF